DHTQRGDLYNLASAYDALSMVARARGKYEEAREYAKQGYACLVTTGDVYIGSYLLREWAITSQLVGDTADAKRRFQASYAIQKDFGDLKGMAETLTRLGWLELLEGD